MWAFAVLASLVVLIVLVLCVPLDINLRVETDGRPKFRIKLAWLFGLVHKEVRRAKKAEVEEDVVEPKPRDRKGDTRLIFEVLRTRGLLRRLGNLLRSILNRIKIREFGANLSIGLDDPVDTGLLFAFIAPANLLLSSSSRHKVVVQPSFAGDAIFEGCLYGVVRLQPVQLVPPVAGFVFSLPAARTVKTLVSAEWRRKK